MGYSRIFAAVWCIPKANHLQLICIFVSHRMQSQLPSLFSNIPVRTSVSIWKSQKRRGGGNRSLSIFARPAGTSQGGCWVPTQFPVAARGGRGEVQLRIQSCWGGWWAWQQRALPLALSFNLLVHEAAAEEEPQLFDQSWRGLIIESLNPAFASPGVNVQREPQNVFRSFWCNLCQKKGTDLLRWYGISNLVIQRYSPANCSNSNALCCHHKVGTGWVKGTGKLVLLEPLPAWLLKAPVLSSCLKAISSSWWLFWGCSEKYQKKKKKH